MFRYWARTMSSIASNRSIDGPMAKTISAKMERSFPRMTHFAMFNDSYKHAGHHGIADVEKTGETHFRLEIVSDEFSGVPLPQRHRMVYQLLQEEMSAAGGGVHALQLITRTVEEQKRREKK